MKIIGIDPGLAATGIGIIRGTRLKVEGFSFGSINTSKKSSSSARLNQIYTELHTLLKEENPDLMVVEEVFSLKEYPKSGIILGQVSGIVLLAGFHVQVPVIEIPVREAKQILTGNGNASKVQLEEAVRHRLRASAPIRPYHASDALGLALIGLYRQRSSD